MADTLSGFNTNSVNDAANRGQNAINSFDPTSVANSTRQGFSDLFGTQQNGINNYVDQYKQTLANNPTTTALYQNANDKYNVQPLAQQATYLQNQVTNQLPQQYQLARGFDVNDNQVQNAANTALRFLQPQATAANAQAQTAQNLANQQVGYGIQQNQMNLLPVQAQGQLTNDLFARQASGFTTSAEQQMQGLLAKMQSGVSLSNNEQNVLAQLATAQEQYQGQLAQANAAQNVAKINASNQILGQGATYYNPNTGQAYNPFVKVGGQ